MKKKISIAVVVCVIATGIMYMGVTSNAKTAYEQEATRVAQAIAGDIQILDDLFSRQEPTKEWAYKVKMTVDDIKQQARTGQSLHVPETKKQEHVHFKRAMAKMSQACYVLNRSVENYLPETVEEAKQLIHEANQEMEQVVHREVAYR